MLYMGKSRLVGCFLITPKCWLILERINKGLLKSWVQSGSRSKEVLSAQEDVIKLLYISFICVGYIRKMVSAFR